MADTSRRTAFKYRVVQEYDVFIYYEEGLSAETLEEAKEQIQDDILDLAFNEEGLVVRLEDETEHGNPYVALVSSFDPVVKELYNVNELPSAIKEELIKRKLI